MTQLPPDGTYNEDGTYTDGTGQVVSHVHPPKACVGEHCVIHNPSDHSMRHYPTMWRGDAGFMERICEHGVGHPDPDGLEGARKLAALSGDQTRIDNAEALGVHGCDGCCGDTPPEPEHVIPSFKDVAENMPDTVRVDHLTDKLAQMADDLEAMADRTNDASGNAYEHASLMIRNLIRGL